VLLQGFQDKQDVAESDMQKGNRELLALKAWGGQIGDLIEAVDEIIKGLDQRGATPGPFHGIDLHEQQLTELTAHFCKVGVVPAVVHSIELVMALPAVVQSIQLVMALPAVVHSIQLVPALPVLVGSIEAGILAEFLKQ
jgi:hypothetical protein